MAAWVSESFCKQCRNINHQRKAFGNSFPKSLQVEPKKLLRSTPDCMFLAVLCLRLKGKRIVLAVVEGHG